MKNKIEIEPQKTYQEIGIISDLHVGSEYFDLAKFEEYLQMISLKRIKVIYSTGDLLEFNDLSNNRIDKETYLKNYNLFIELLSRYEVEIINLRGNHEKSLSNHEPELYLEIQQQSKQIIFLNEDHKVLFILGKRIKIGHYLEESEPEADYTIGGHTHYKKRTNKFLNAGTFRRHHIEKMPIGGFILGVTNKHVSLTPIGDYAFDSNYLKEIESNGLYPNITEIEQEKRINNNEIYFYKSIRKV